jgi:hypothetical protein
MNQSVPKDREPLRLIAGLDGPAQGDPAHLPSLPRTVVSGPELLAISGRALRLTLRSCTCTTAYVWTRAAVPSATWGS